jgi:hypothetical protein
LLIKKIKNNKQREVTKQDKEHKKMGRYYYGDIVGKFWFAIQSSDDPENVYCENFGNEMRYKVCCCQSVNNTHDENDYCSDCFSSKKEHWGAIVEDDSDDTSKLCYEINDSITKWVAYQTDVPKIHDVTIIIDELIHIYKYIERIDFNEDAGFGMEIQFTKEFENNKNENVEKLLARYCLAKQIYEYFRKTNNETCVFYGEN